MQELGSLLPIIGIGLLFWLLIIRPQSRRQKAMGAMQSALEPGVDVMLSAGIFGTVETVEDDRVTVRVADGVVLQVIKGAIATVVAPEEVTESDIDPVDRPTEES